MGPGIRRAGRALGDRQLRPATRSGTPTGPGPHGAAILGLPMWVCPLAFSPESTGPRRCTGGRSRVQAMVGAQRSNARPPEPYSGAGHAPEPDSCVQGVYGVQSVPHRARNGPRTPGASHPPMSVAWPPIRQRSPEFTEGRPGHRRWRGPCGGKIAAGSRVVITIRNNRGRVPDARCASHPPGRADRPVRSRGHGAKSAANPVPETEALEGQR